MQIRPTDQPLKWRKKGCIRCGRDFDPKVWKFYRHRNKKTGVVYFNWYSYCNDCRTILLDAVSEKYPVDHAQRMRENRMKAKRKVFEEKLNGL